MSKSEAGDDEARKRPSARRVNLAGQVSQVPESFELASNSGSAKRVSARRVSAAVAPNSNGVAVNAGSSTTREASARATTDARSALPVQRAASARSQASVRRPHESRATRSEVPAPAQDGAAMVARSAFEPSAAPGGGGGSASAAVSGNDSSAHAGATRPGGFARDDDDLPFNAPAARLHSDAPIAESASSGMLSALTRRASAALRVRVEPVDEFGLDTAYELRLRPFFEAMCRSYLRVELLGAEHVPAHGRALLVSNHSRALPWDGVMLRTALRLHHATQRQPRWLVEDDQFHAPFLGTFVSRLGAVRACQENAERLLLRDELVAVFPEGRAEKTYSERHKLQRFGRGGYVKLALRTGAPVIPVAIVGREEPLPLLDKVSALSKWVGLPLFALAPALPKLGPLGVPPIPSRWQIVIGEPIREIARQDVEATREEGLIHELNECVRSAVQHLVDQTLAASA